MHIHVDFETRSTTDLRKSGVHRYVEDPNTAVWCMGWAINYGPVEMWKEGDLLPKRLEEAIRQGATLHAWNAQFERVIWNAIQAPRYGWPVLTLPRWSCVMARAALQSLPQKLGEAAKAILPEEFRKDDYGSALCKRMAKPRRWDGNEPVWWYEETRLERLYDYCATDVVVERELSRRIPYFSPSEWNLYQADQRANDRGIMIDVPLVIAASEVAAEGIERLSEKMRTITDGAVPKITNTGALLKWTQEQGVKTTTVKRGYLEDALEFELVEGKVKEAFETRVEGGRTSIAKLESMAQCWNNDERARGLLVFSGASSTGRWSGRRVQPQNLPRGEFKDTDLLVELILSESPELVELVFGSAVIGVSSALRSCFIAGPGRELAAGDYAQIEARILAWLAGQDDVLDLFRGSGRVYEDMASDIYRVDEAEITKGDPRRQTGKMAVLACGFGMGGKTFRTQAKDTYGVRIDQSWADHIVGVFREKNTRIVQLWYDTERAAMEAVRNPGVVTTAGRLKFLTKGWFLCMILPSGRSLMFCHPAIVKRPAPWDASQLKAQLRVHAVNPYTRKWGPRFLYGGLLVENATQATARDVMAVGFLNAEKAGYPPLLTVHDEIITEPEAGYGNAHELEELMCDLPSWTRGLPVKAEAWIGHRYRK